MKRLSSFFSKGEGSEEGGEGEGGGGGGGGDCSLLSLVRQWQQDDAGDEAAGVLAVPDTSTYPSGYQGPPGQFATSGLACRARSIQSESPAAKTLWSWLTAVLAVQLTARRNTPSLARLTLLDGAVVTAEESLAAAAAVVDGEARPAAEAAGLAAGEASDFHAGIVKDLSDAVWRKEYARGLQDESRCIMVGQWRARLESEGGGPGRVAAWLKEVEAEDQADAASFLQEFVAASASASVETPRGVVSSRLYSGIGTFTHEWGQPLDR